MNRRLQKKKRVGEFREFGFPVRFGFSEQLSFEERNSLLDRWIRSAVEANRLQFGGGGGSNIWEGFVTLEGRGSATDDHRRIVDQWLSKEPRVLQHEVGPLIDAWYADVGSWFDRKDLEGTLLTNVTNGTSPD